MKKKNRSLRRVDLHPCIPTSHHPRIPPSPPAWLLEEMPLVPRAAWPPAHETVTRKCLGTSEREQCHHSRHRQAFPPDTEQDVAPWHAAPTPSLGDLGSAKAEHGAGTAPPTPVFSAPRGCPRLQPPPSPAGEQPDSPGDTKAAREGEGVWQHQAPNAGLQGCAWAGAPRARPAWGG